MRMEYNGKVDETGKLHIFRRKDFAIELKQFTGKPVKITVDRQDYDRSEANRGKE